MNYLLVIALPPVLLPGGRDPRGHHDAGTHPALCLMHGDAVKKPVLLLHAWGESRGSFDRLMRVLA